MVMRHVKKCVHSILGRSDVTSRVIIGAVLVSVLTAGPAAGFPAEMTAVEGEPFPLVLLDPLEAEGDLSPPVASPERHEDGALGELPAWQILNWRINSDTTTQLQNEEQVAVNPLDPDNLVAVWRDFRLGYRRVGVGYTFDGGVTWHDELLVEPDYPRHSDPGVTVDADGNFYIVILAYTGSTAEENGLYVYRSEDGGVTWSDGVPAVNQVPNVFEDKELMACDRTGGFFDGNLYVAWARFGSSVDIMNVTSSDGGTSFGTPVLVNDESSVQWPCPVVGPDGTYYVAWVQFSTYEIRLDRSLSGGASFGTDVVVTDIAATSTTINGGITVFGFPAMDCDIFGGTHNGRLYIAYMDDLWGDYDIFMRYSDDHGTTWSAPVRINDDAIGSGRDQFHPWTCVSSDGVVNVVFYDRRNDPSNFLMDLYLTQSFDGGLTFEPNVRVTTVSSDPTAGSARAGLIGEYIGLAAATADRVHPVWTDTREGHQDVYTSIVDTTFVGVQEGGAVAALRLSAPRPNPMRREAQLHMVAPPGRAVAVTVCDVSGRVVRTLCAEPGRDGSCSVVWDGTDAAGGRVASGVYFVRASDGASSATAKLVHLR
jgi:hypothetical protein